MLFVNNTLFSPLSPLQKRCFVCLGHEVTDNISANTFNCRAK